MEGVTSIYAIYIYIYTYTYNYFDCVDLGRPHISNSRHLLPIGVFLVFGPRIASLFSNLLQVATKPQSHTSLSLVDGAPNPT